MDEKLHKITIGGIEYVIENNNYTKLLFEVVAKKSWYKIDINTITDRLYLFYACLKANNDHFKMTFEDFVLIEEKGVLDNFILIYAAQIEVDNIPVEGDEKKKNPGKS